MKSYLAEITKAKFEDGKTTLQIEIPENILNDMSRYKTKYLEVLLSDNRTISPEQRRKIYATIADLMEHWDDSKTFWKEFFKALVIAETGCQEFSLSDCSVTTAREYLNVMMKFCIENGIPLRDTGINRTDDVDKYLYYCIANRVCCITGRPNADIHHVGEDRVGMGRNRNKIDHTNLKLMALSREWHTKVHAEGEEEIFEAHKIYGITVDKETLKKLKLNIKEID